MSPNPHHLQISGAALAMMAIGSPCNTAIGYANSGTMHLPGDVVSSSSVNIFKGRLDNYLRTIGGIK